MPKTKWNMIHLFSKLSNDMLSIQTEILGKWIKKKQLGNISIIGNRLLNINEGATRKYRSNLFDDKIYHITYLNDAYNFSSIFNNHFSSIDSACILLCAKWNKSVIACNFAYKMTNFVQNSIILLVFNFDFIGEKNCSWR